MEKLMTPRPRITIPSHVPRPVRYDWLMAAATLSGKSLHLALALSWLAGLAHSPKVKLTRATMRRFSLSRDACYDGLRKMEAARLVSVWRLPGRSPMVILLGPDEKPMTTW